MRTAAASLLAVLLLLIVAATAAGASTSQIAYSDRGGSLYVAGLDGTSPKALFTSDGSVTMQALDLSSDGKQVLALQYGDHAQLALVPAAGGAPAVVSGTDAATSASFSPDGTKLVFATIDSSPGSPAGIYTVSVAGGTPKLIAATPANATDALPEYSPDGTKLAFVRDGYDSQNNETVSLELMPAAGGSPNALTTKLAPDLGSGGHLSFSPDGTKIAFAGDFSSPGIFTVSTAGGNATRLTSDYDYWPSFSADGSKVYFSRDATSDHADDNAPTPAAPVTNDLYELWTVKRDGSGEKVVAEGDFENLALAASAPSAATTSPAPNPSLAPAPGATPTPGPATTATGDKSPGKSQSVGTRSVTVTAKGSHYIVDWSGKAKSWTVILRVGTTTATARVKGTIHSHVFVLAHAHAHGTASARVKTP